MTSPTPATRMPTCQLHAVSDGWSCGPSPVSSSVSLHLSASLAATRGQPNKDKRRHVVCYVRGRGGRRRGGGASTARHVYNTDDDSVEGDYINSNTGIEGECMYTDMCNKLQMDMYRDNVRYVCLFISLSTGYS
eukprot:GHVQ01032207.1.p1 GENE.GHVQ01032207.1~~GHVQ01032207.1.p1  ORF type:complete len:134 (+),score=23.92 GHVQ01032207.1:272-673(+)